MKELIFATNNLHKLEEVQQILQDKYKIVSLAQIGVTEDIPETGDTLAENALIKARYIFKKTGKDCFADDTGLEVMALNNEPGVKSARYAGEPSNSERNISKLLENLGNTTQRTAKFKTVIALILNRKEYLFEGSVEGEITNKLSGKAGFGYDPVFLPKGYTRTFAEMTAEEKNSISHRGKAVQKLVDFLAGI